MIAIMEMMLALAAGQPTYLQCSFARGGPPVDVIADEANSAVTVSLATTGYTQKMAAAFTPTQVRFQNELVSYVISRTDLHATRTIRSISSSEDGTCKVQTAPKRAF